MQVHVPIHNCGGHSALCLWHNGHYLVCLCPPRPCLIGSHGICVIFRQFTDPSSKIGPSCQALIVGAMLQAWGQDVHTCQRIFMLGTGQGWSNWDVRLSKVIRSLYLFEQADLMESVQMCVSVAGLLRQPWLSSLSACPRCILR